MQKNIDLKLELKKFKIKKYELAKALKVSSTQFSNMINLVEIVDYEKARIITLAKQLEEMKK